MYAYTSPLSIKHSIHTVYIEMLSYSFFLFVPNNSNTFFKIFGVSFLCFFFIFIFDSNYVKKNTYDVLFFLRFLLLLYFVFVISLSSLFLCVFFSGGALSRSKCSRCCCLCLAFFALSILCLFASFFFLSKSNLYT